MIEWPIALIIAVLAYTVGRRERRYLGAEAIAGNRTKRRWAFPE